MQERLDARAGQDETAQRRRGHDVRDRRLAEDDRDLAEEVAPAETGTLRAVDDDRRLAFEDDEEPGAGQTLAQDLVALAEDGLFEQVDDALELRIGQVGEQAEACDRVNKLCAVDHDRQWCQMRRRHGRRRMVDGPQPCGAAWPGTLAKEPHDPHPRQQDGPPVEGPLVRRRRRRRHGSDRRRGGRGGVPGGSCHQPPGRDRHGLLRHRVGRGPGGARGHRARPSRAGRLLRGAVRDRRPAPHRAGHRGRADDVPRDRDLGLRGRADGRAARRDRHPPGAGRSPARPDRSRSDIDPPAGRTGRR